MRKKGTRQKSICVALAIGLAAWGSVVRAQSVSVESSLNTRLTFTDNVGASASDRKSDWIAEISPGISIARQSGRFRGNLSAEFRTIGHASESDRNTGFLGLTGRGELEAIEDLFFVDFEAAISRDNRSGLSGRGAGDFLDVSKQNQTQTFSIGPRLQFNVAGDTEVVLGYRSRWFDGGGDIRSRRVGTWQTRVSSPQSFGYFGWGFDYQNSQITNDGEGERDQSSEVARATLFVRVTPQFRLRGIVGHEWNDLDSRSGDSGTITGGGFDWNPTDRTAISATVENRVFGRGFDISMQHRHALWAWDLAWSRDFSSSLETRSVVTDDRYRAWDDLLKSVLPDPVERDRFIRDVLLRGAQIEQANFVSNANFVANTLATSFSLIGSRNALTLSLSRAERERLGGPVTNDPFDDFAIFEKVTTTSGALSLSHRLSAATSLNASVTRSRSKGAGTGSSETRRTAYSLGVSTSLGARTLASLIYRHQRADGFTDFTENVITATLGMRF